MPTTKEIYVNLSLPYQMTQFMYGKVELGALVILEPGDDEKVIRRAKFCELRDEAKVMADQVVRGPDMDRPNVPVPQGPISESGRRRRIIE